MALKVRTLGLISAMGMYRYEGAIYMHTSYGRIVDALAARYEHVLLSAPMVEGVPDSTADYRLKADNLRLVPQPFYRGSKQALMKLPGILRSYGRVCRQAEAVFVRGVMPFVGLLYTTAFIFRCRICLWVIGNPEALLRSHRRNGFFSDRMALLFGIQGRCSARLGRWLTGGSFVCNGGELGALFKSARTFVTVSTTVTDEEFYDRADTCEGRLIRILFIGFVRPEKGLEFLIEAVGKIRTDRAWEVVLVGSCEQYGAYRRKLDKLIEQFDLAGRVRWEGYVAYGPEMFRYLRECDVFVLPTLSEGTPRVLVEARANSLPVIATTVGGIPTSVTDGVDGILVPPKDSDAIAQALDRVIEDGELRRSLIRNGLRSAREMTVDRFADVVEEALESTSG